MSVWTVVQSGSAVPALEKRRDAASTIELLSEHKKPISGVQLCLIIMDTSTCSDSMCLQRPRLSACAALLRLSATSKVRKPFLGVLRLSSLLLAMAVARAEQLPIKRYTTADGLPNNFINRIVRDSRGYLWFCTDEGLSRFDGYRFVNYSTEAGLNPIVRDLLETRAGVYWVASGGALYRFNPLGRLPRPAPGTGENSASSGRRQASPEPLFVAYRPVDIQINSIITLFEDSRGTIWCGTTQGLFRVEEDAGRHTLRLVDFGQPSQSESDVRVRAIVEDGQGALWIAAISGLYRRWTDGRTERYTMQHGLPVNEIRNLLLTVDQQLWAGTIHGLCQIVPEPGPDKKVVSRVYTEEDGLEPSNVRSLFKTSSGRVLAGVSGSLRELTTPGSKPGESTGTFSTILRGFQVVAIEEDQDQNLWIGTDSGAVKLVPGGFTTYQTGDGLRHPVIFSLFADQQGGLYATTLAKELVISRFSGTRFISVRPKLHGVRYFGWGENQLTLQDSRGEWWVPTGEGLFRFPRVKSFELLAQTEPKAVYTSRNGLPLDDVFRLYEDSSGDLWIATFSEARGAVTRWQRSSETFHTFSEAEGLPENLPNPNSVREDGHGNLWIGCNRGLLLRFRNGRFAVFGEKHGVPGIIAAIHRDRQGRLWIGSTLGGLSRIEDSSAEVPRFVSYTTANGLSSNHVTCITEDQWGRIYAGTGRGVDRLDTHNGRIKHLTTAEGLAGGHLRAALRDGQGHLWFGAVEGLSRLVPQPDIARQPPPILISRLHISGRDWPISELGQAEVSSIQLGPRENQVQIDFVALGFAPGDKLLYQYRLDGTDQNWNLPTDQRAVHYASLQPGSYRFQVRAVNSDGLTSPSPATVTFSILPPLWQRWWFLAFTALTVAGLAHWLHRYRVARLLELEAVRTKIATDLHDDIGSNLSQIAVWSEVAKQRSAGGKFAEQSGDGFDPLEHIATTARDTSSAMSDIVWAINPRRDHLSDLVLRMRRFAGEAFGARDIAWQFSAPETDFNLDAHTRRELFLIFKESANNVLRHSLAGRVDITLSVNAKTLRLAIRDDGCGFDSQMIEQNNGGAGLDSMRMRAKNLGGTLQIHSTPGGGTAMTLEVPLGRRRWQLIRRR